MNKVESSFVEEAVVPTMPEYRQPDEQGFWELRRQEWGNERGSLGKLFGKAVDMTPVLGNVKAGVETGVEAGTGAGSFAWKHKGSLLVAGTAMAALVATMYGGSSVEASADIAGAHTAANIYDLEFDKNTAITPGTIYSKENYIATGIEYQFVLHGCLTKFVCHDFHSPGWLNPDVNKMMLGAEAQNVPTVPLNAIKAYRNGDKIDVVVDESRIIDQLSFSGEGPTVLNFTGDPSNPNTKDQHGFRDQFVNGLGKIAAIGNIDGPSNDYDNLDAKVDSDLKEDALNALKVCVKKPAFVSAEEKIVETAVRDTIDSLPGTPEIARFSFTHKTIGFKVDTGQRADQLLTSGTVGQASYKLGGAEPYADNIQCTATLKTVGQ